MESSGNGLGARCSSLPGRPGSSGAASGQGRPFQLSLLRCGRGGREGGMAPLGCSSSGCSHQGSSATPEARRAFRHRRNTAAAGTVCGPFVLQDERSLRAWAGIRLSEVALYDGEGSRCTSGVANRDLLRRVELRSDRPFNFHHSFPLPGYSCKQGACCVRLSFPSPNLNS